MEVAITLAEALEKIIIMAMLGIITGTVLVIPRYFRYAQDQRDHQAQLLGQILNELERLNRKN